MTGLMLEYSRRVMIAAAALLALAAMPAAASVQVAETRLTATASALTFRASGLEGSVVCPVTIAATMRGEISETERSLAGEVTEARVGEGSCTGGTITSLTATSVRLISFRLGKITLGIEGAFLVSAAGGLVRCLYRGEPEVTNSADPIASLRSVESVTIPLSSSLRGSLTCPRSGSMVGEFRVTPEIAYTDTAVPALRPAMSVLEFAETQQTKEMLFINEWIVPVAITGAIINIGIRLRFARVPGATECPALGAIESGEGCVERIQLHRAREPGENVSGSYALTVASVFVMGFVTLEK